MGKIALPYYQDGKRIMFPGAENFGPGSFNTVQRIHSFKITKSILPCKLISISKDGLMSQLTEPTIFNGILINLFEN